MHIPILAIADKILITIAVLSIIYFYIDKTQGKHN